MRVVQYRTDSYCKRHYDQVCDAAQHRRKKIISIRANIGHSPLQHDLSAWRHDDALMGGTAPEDNKGRIKTWACLFAFCVLCLYLSPAVADMSQPNDVTQEAMQRLFATASAPSPAWTGPSTGPAGVTKKIVALIAEDLRNGGILGVAQGVSEAARELRWQIKIFDARGTPQGRKEAAADALAAHPDGVVLIGADVKAMAAHLKLFTRLKIPITGWHVGPVAGPMSDTPVAVNVSTDPLEVARVTSMAAVADPNKRSGVVIFTDSNFRIALAKSTAMAEVIRACQHCVLLEVCDVAISKSAEIMPGVTRELLARFGKRWTHALAINDIYFDYAVPELIKAGRLTRDLKLLSAGDGSVAAFLRIQSGLFQTATVAEPLNLQGWQLVDELNRLLNHRPLDGHVIPVHLVTPDNIAYDGGPQLRFDPDNGYRDIYRQIWRVK